MDATMLLGAATLGVLFIAYFIPAVVAHHRDHQSKTGIFILNIFLGWTFLGWVIALIWAASSTKPSQTVIYQTIQSTSANSNVSTCPSYDGEIVSGALKCRHCGASFG